MESNATDDFRHNLIRYGGDVYPEIVERAQGCYVWDARGKKILDFTSGQMCATVGHSHPNIVAAIKKSCDTALHLFSGMIPRSVVQLAEATRKVGVGSVQEVVLVELSRAREAVHDVARRARAVDHRHRDGAVEGHDGGGRHSLEARVNLDDGRPIRVLLAARAGVHRGQRRLQSERPRL